MNKFCNHLRKPSFFKDDSFLNSPAYYMVTGRRGSWVYSGYQSMVVVCYHPGLDNTLMIFPEIGKGDGNLLCDVLCHLGSCGLSIQLSRFTKKDIQMLRRRVKSRSLSSFFQINMINEENMDWVFPVHIFNTQHVSEMNGPRFRNIRQKYRQIDQENIIMHSLSHPYALSYIKAAHKYWLGNQIIFNLEKNKNNIDDFYDRLFSLIEKSPEYFDGQVVLYNNKPVSFSIWDHANYTTVNLIANLSDTFIRGLSEFHFVETCRSLHAKGVKLLNRGGSEDRGLDQFKSKFSPVNSYTLYSAHVSFKPINQRINMSILMPPLQNKPHPINPIQTQI